MTKHRCVIFLGSVLLVLITGCRCQCEGGNKFRTLKANPSRVGKIFSPGYPDNYPDNSDCKWKLYTDPGYLIHLHVAWIDVEESVDCGFDNLNLHDGRSTNSPLIARLCHSDYRRRDYYSAGSYMYITFTSDFSINSDGFLLEYSAIRPRHVPTTSVSPIDSNWHYTTSSTASVPRSGDLGWPSYQIAALIGGLTGGLLLLFVLCALCRYYYSRYRGPTISQNPRPYYTPPQPPPPSYAPSAPHPSTLYQNSNAVFMVSSASHHHHHHLHPTSAYGGETNLAFSPFGEAPPAYFAVQHSTTSVVQPGSGQSAVPGMGLGVGVGCPPPPSYTEAMRLSHPPAASPPVLAMTTALPPVPPFQVPSTTAGQSSTPLQQQQEQQVAETTAVVSQ